MFGTSDATHLVLEVDGNVPKRNKLEAAGFMGSVIGRTRLAACGADGFAVLARMNHGNDVLIGGPFLVKGNCAKAEGLVMGKGIQYSLEEHLGWKKNASCSKPTFYLLITEMLFYKKMNEYTHYSWWRASFCSIVMD